MKRSSSHAIAKFSCVPVVSHPPSPGETWHGGISVNFFEVFSQLVAKVAAAELPSCEIETRSSSTSRFEQLRVLNSQVLQVAKSCENKTHSWDKKIHSSNWAQPHSSLG